MKINDRIRKIRLNNNLTQKEFAELLKITQGNLSLIEAHKASVSLDMLIALHTEYKLSYGWLIDGDEVFKYTDRLIPLIAKSAMAGYPANHGTKDYEDKLALYKIPGFDDGGEYKIFEIEGESMLPTLLPHDYVVSVKIDDFSKIVDGSLAIVITQSEVLAKRIYLEKKSSLKLVSDNPKYEPVIYKFSKIQEVWGLQAKITQSFMTTESLDSNVELKHLKEEVNQMKYELENIKRKLT